MCPLQDWGVLSEATLAGYKAHDQYQIWLLIDARLLPNWGNSGLQD